MKLILNTLCAFFYVVLFALGMWELNENEFSIQLFAANSYIDWAFILFILQMIFLFIDYLLPTVDKGPELTKEDADRVLNADHVIEAQLETVHARVQKGEMTTDEVVIEVEALRRVYKGDDA